MLAISYLDLYMSRHRIDSDALSFNMQCRRYILYHPLQVAVDFFDQDEYPIAPRHESSVYRNLGVGCTSNDVGKAGEFLFSLGRRGDRRPCKWAFALGNLVLFVRVGLPVKRVRLVGDGGFVGGGGGLRSREQLLGEGQLGRGGT